MKTQWTVLIIFLSLTMAACSKGGGGGGAANPPKSNGLADPTNPNYNPNANQYPPLANDDGGYDVCSRVVAPFQQSILSIETSLSRRYGWTQFVNDLYMAEQLLSTLTPRSRAYECNDTVDNVRLYVHRAQQKLFRLYGQTAEVSQLGNIVANLYKMAN